MSFINLVGQRFSKLLVIRRVPNPFNSKVRWACQCDCGNYTEVQSNNLRSGQTKSCGCLRVDANTTHGASGTKDFWVYHSAKSRCTSPTDPKYSEYGGRGIEFRFTSLDQFMTELGPKPSPQHTVDRKDNNGHYEPGNIHWATKSEQVHNRRSRKDNKSGYLGVSLASRSSTKWVAQIFYNGRNHHLGTFTTKEEAARRYDREAATQFGDKARLNFPQEGN